MAAANSLPASGSTTAVEESGPATSRTRSVWLLQLSLAVSVVITVLVVQALRPELFGVWTFAAGIAVIIAVTAVTLVVKWDRVPQAAILAVPAVDLIGVSLLAFGTDLRFGFFWAFPIIWIATHFALPALLVALAVVGMVILLESTIAGPNAVSTLRLLIVMLSLTFVGLTTYLTARQNRAFKQLLRRQAARLQGSLQRVSGQERRVSQMLNGLDTGIARLTRGGEVLAVNDTYVALYAIDREEPTRPGRAVEYSAMRGEPLPESERPLARAARGEIFEDERVWLFDTQGEWHALSVSTRPLSPAAGEPDSILLIVHDVTALIEAERARERMAAVVSHELRNPLTAIMGHAELALETPGLPAKTREQLEVIDNAAVRMQTLISEILAEARSAERHSEPEPVDVRRILDASLESFRPAADGRRVTIRLEAADTLPVAGDAFRLRQAVDNLLSNAIKYTPGGGTVDISARVADGRVIIVMADTGIGIGPADLARIFDPYFRTRAARESAAPGTGLGMAIVRTIVDEHSGTLEIESEVGTGTTVTLSLPALDEAR